MSPDKHLVTAKRLKWLMDMLGADQYGLASAIGCSQGAISQILLGNSRRSRLLPMIAEWANVNLSWLTGASDELIWLFDENGDEISEDELARIKVGKSKTKILKPSADQLWPRQKSEMTLAKRLSTLMEAAGISQSALSDRVGVTQQTIGKLVRGEALNSVHLHKIARALGTSVEYLTGETDDEFGPVLIDQHLMIDNMVPVREIDLSFGMGATFLDVPVTEEVRLFPLDWLRAFTKASPDQLFFARGIGDSMFPTIADADTLLIDTSQQNIAMADRIWAVAWGEVGMIKRLRPLPNGNCDILSDNPSVPPISASDGEMAVIGRVVAVVRKI